MILRCDAKVLVLLPWTLLGIELGILSILLLLLTFVVYQWHLIWLTG
jgi:hypothetical protein